MTKISKRNTKNSNKNSNVINKKQKVVQTPLNDKNPPDDNDFLKKAPTEKLSENQHGKLPEHPIPPPELTSPNEYKAPSWDALIVEEMNVDDEDANISVSSDFLVNPP